VTTARDIELACRLVEAGRSLEAELELRPLRARTRERDELPQPAADYEAQQGVESFARWARKTLAPALRATEIGTWDDVHNVCGRFGVVVRLHGNGLVFEDAEQDILSTAAAASSATDTRPRSSSRFLERRRISSRGSFGRPSSCVSRSLLRPTMIEPSFNNPAEAMVEASEDSNSG